MDRIYLVIEDDALCQSALPVAAFESEEDASVCCEKWNTDMIDQLMSYYTMEVNFYSKGEEYE